MGSWKRRDISKKQKSAFAHSLLLLCLHHQLLLSENKTADTFNEAQWRALKGGQEQLKNRKQLSADVYRHGIINIHVCSNWVPTEEGHWGAWKRGREISSLATADQGDKNCKGGRWVLKVFAQFLL